MANLFNSDVHKQVYIAGVQDENRDSVPMKIVSEIETEPAEYMYNRYGSDMTAQLSSDSTYTTPDFTYSADSKLIDVEAIAADRITYKELSRQGFDLIADRTDKHAFAIAKAVHRTAYRATRLGAGDQIDALDINGTGNAGDRLSLSDSNPDNLTATAVQFLQESNAFTGQNPYAMMTPKHAKNFNLFSMGAGFGFADQALKGGAFQVGGARVIRGAMGFGGLDLIITNEVERYRVATFTDETDAGDTITIAVGSTTITFTAAASPSAAGDVDIAAGGDEEGMVDNYVAAINGGAGAGTTYVDVSAANRALLNTWGVKARKIGTDKLEVSAFVDFTLGETGDETSLGSATSPILVGAYNSTTIAMPSNGANVVEKEPPLFSGIELMFSQLHDATVWTKNRDKIKEILVAQ
jgi:hypothetical protein